MKKLNILIFDGSEKKATFVDRLILGLVQHGHRVSVAGFHSDKKGRINGVQYINLGTERNKLKFVVVSFRWLFSTLFKSDGLGRFLRLLKGFMRSDAKAIKKVNFLNAVLQTKPDLVHVQWLSLLPLCEELIEKDLTKLVLSQRGTHINVRPFIDADNFNYLKLWFSKIDGFHSVCNSIKQKSALIYTSQNKIDDVVYSGLKLEHIEFNSDYKKNKTLKLLSVGRPHWIKGYASMLRVCRLLKENGIHFSYTIVGIDHNEEELVYLIVENKLEKQVLLKPKMSQNQVFRLMKSASALVVPSLEEGIANVAIEAMAIGLPVISTKCGGMAELIDDGKSGFLVPLHDDEAFAKTIMNLNHLERNAIDMLRLEARKKVESQHGVENMINAMGNLYYKCLT